MFIRCWGHKDIWDTDCPTCFHWKLYQLAVFFCKNQKTQNSSKVKIIYLFNSNGEFEMRKWLRRKKKWENDTCEVSSDKTPSLAPVLRLCSGIAHVNVYGLHVEHWLVTTAVGNSSSINRICFQVVLCKTITCEFHVSCPNSVDRG